MSRQTIAATSPQLKMKSLRTGDEANSGLSSTQLVSSARIPTHLTENIILQKLLQTCLPLFQEVWSESTDMAFPRQDRDHRLSIRKSFAQLLSQTVKFGISMTPLDVFTAGNSSASIVTFYEVPDRHPSEWTPYIATPHKLQCRWDQIRSHIHL